jgi:hypothetical protein
MARRPIRWLTAPEVTTIAAPPCRHDGNHPTAPSFAGECGSRAILGASPLSGLSEMGPARPGTHFGVPG